MTLVHLTPKPAVHIPAIDSEHSQIHESLNELGNAVTAGAAVQEMGSLVERLITAINLHFRHEERLMRASRYAEYTWHKRQHATALRKVEVMRSAHGAGEFGLTVAGLESIDAWFRDHISVADTMASAHLRNYERETGIRIKASRGRS